MEIEVRKGPLKNICVARPSLILTEDLMYNYFKPNLLGGDIVVVGLHTATGVPGLITGVDF